MEPISEKRVIKENAIAFYKASYKKWVQIKLADIMYIDTLTRQSIRFVFKDLITVHSQEPLTRIIDLFPGNFIRIHRSCVVNMDYVEYFDYRKRVLVLHNGKELKLGASYNENIEQFAI